MFFLFVSFRLFSVFVLRCDITIFRMDYSAVEAIKDLTKQYEKHDKTVYLERLSPDAAQLLSNVFWNDNRFPLNVYIVEEQIPSTEGEYTGGFARRQAVSLL
jgi:MFS superfamily sulfate permease-like transporter